MLSHRLIFLGVSAVVWLGILLLTDRLLPRRIRPAFRLIAGAVTYVAGLAALQRVRLGGFIGVDVARGAIVALAIAALLYERQRRGSGRPVSASHARRVGIALGVTAVCGWYGGARYGWAGGIHVWDQFHYYMGARYHTELGYDRLYRCAALAHSELGSQLERVDGQPRRVDMGAEARQPGRMLRNLGVDNGMIPESLALDHPELCRGQFSPRRWEAFRADVLYFRLALGAQGWSDVLRDHGYNPPPAWTTLAAPLVRLHPASTRFLQLLALLDVALVLATFAALAWAFGWRTAALGAVFWGTQAFSSFYWTGGALLRQDWLFLVVLSACLMRTRRPGAAGAAWALAVLLRLFPLLLAAGWLVRVATRLGKRRPPARAQLRFAGGAVLTVLLALPLTVAVTGRQSWPEFARHIRLHEGTAVSNLVGLRPLLSVRPLPGGPTGRMRDLIQPAAPDPFVRWKEVRGERERAARPLWWLLLVAGGLGFVLALRRVRTGWAAYCLSQLWLVLVLQLTCYYYSFLVLAAPLARKRRELEITLLSLAALSQLAWAASRYFDDRAILLSALAVGFCAMLLWRFARTGTGASGQIARRPEPAPAG